MQPTAAANEELSTKVCSAKPPSVIYVPRLLTANDSIASTGLQPLCKSTSDRCSDGEASDPTLVDSSDDEDFEGVPQVRQVHGIPGIHHSYRGSISGTSTVSSATVVPVLPTSEYHSI